MSDLMKKVFNDKRYQFGYNDAMDVAFNSERDLQAKVDDILSAISRGDYSYVESVYLDYDDDGNPPVAALKQEAKPAKCLDFGQSPNEQEVSDE